MIIIQSSVTMSINNSNNKEQRKPFLALIGHDNTTASILGLMLLAAASFALISYITPMTAALAQELANNNTAMQAGSGGVRSSSACTRTQTGEIFDDGVRSSELLTSIRLSNDMKKSCDVRPRITDGLTN